VAACGGWGLVSLITVLFVLYSAAQVGQNSWLSYWSEHRSDHSQQWFLNVYIAIGGVNIAVLLLRNVTYCLSGLRGAHRMHEQLLSAVIRAPLSFFHTTPTGRILNRFSQDTCVSAPPPTFHLGYPLFSNPKSPSSAHSRSHAQVRFSATGELGYSGIRGAEG
jgi:hypothetical protein